MGSRVNIQPARDAEAPDAPERTCAVTRACAHPTELIRFVAAPDGSVVPDVNCKLPGRGVWVGCRRDLVLEAVKKRAFSRGLKCAVNTDADLADRVDDLLLRNATQALSIANKAGVVTTGFAKVEGLILKGRCDALAQAHDAAEDGRKKLFNKHRAVAEELARHAHLVDQLSIDELSLALGGSNVVHAGLSEGRVTDTFVLAAQRLERYRATAPNFSGVEHAKIDASGDAAGTMNSAARKTG